MTDEYRFKALEETLKRIDETVQGTDRTIRGHNGTLGMTHAILDLQRTVGDHSTRLASFDARLASVEAAPAIVRDALMAEFGSLRSEVRGILDAEAATRQKQIEQAVTGPFPVAARVSWVGRVVEVATNPKVVLALLLALLTLLGIDIKSLI